MNCPQCQRPVQVGSSFCDHCGNKLAGSAGSAGSARTVQASPPNFPPTGHGAAPGFAPTVMASRSSTSPKASGAPHCPQCGAKAIAGQAFCEECGGSLATVDGKGQAPSWQPPQSSLPRAYQSYQEPAAPHQRPAPPPPPPPPLQRPLPPSQKPAYQPPPRSAPPVQVPPTVVYKPPAQKQKKPAGPIPPTVVYKAPPVKQPKLIIAGSGTVLDFGGKTEVLIGREDPIAGIFPQIDMTAHQGKEGGVSRQHAKICQQGHQWIIEDLNSVNHTYVNKKRVTPGYPHPLNKGDEIRLGRAILRFELF